MSIENSFGKFKCKIFLNSTAAVRLTIILTVLIVLLHRLLLKFKLTLDIQKTKFVSFAQLFL